MKRKLSFGWILFLHAAFAWILTGTFTITVTAATAPEIAVEQPAGTDLTDGVSSIGFGAVNVGSSSAAKTFTITNTGTAALTISGVSVTGGNPGDFAVNTSGMLTSVAIGGSTTFTVTFTPGAAGARGTTLQIASDDADEATFDIALTGTGMSCEDPPHAFADNLQAFINTPSLIDVLANDSPGCPGTTIRVTKITGSPANGVPEILPDGSAIIYTPFWGNASGDLLGYTITDNLGRSATSTVNIGVINRAPVANNITVNVHVGDTDVELLTPTTFSDPDNYSTPIFTPDLAGLTHGTATPSMVTLQNTIQYQGADQVWTENIYSLLFTATSLGTDVIPYTVKDGLDFRSSGTITLHVTPRNDPPSAPNQTFVRAPGLTLKIKITDVLAACSDPDGGTPALDSVGASVQGATISTTATHILYALAADNSDSFPYTISDGQGGTTTGTITVQVVNPGGLAQSITPGIGGSVTVNFAGIPGFTYDVQRATDPGGPWATVNTQIAPPHGLFSYTNSPPPPLPPTAYYRLQQHLTPTPP